MTLWQHRRPFLRKQSGMAENLEREQTGDDQTKQAKHQTAGALDFSGAKAENTIKRCAG
jgi:hypothetical protein